MNIPSPSPSPCPRPVSYFDFGTRTRTRTRTREIAHRLSFYRLLSYTFSMKKWLLCLLLLISCSSSNYPYQLAVCAIFKNEAPWLKEWIVYHHDILGFERFYLYNNDSSDNYEEVLRPFIEKGIVELIDWNSKDESHKYPGKERDNPSCPWHEYQLGAYNECLKKRALGKAKWVAVIDVDEFIVPVKGVRSFHRNLRSAEKRRKGSIKFSWRMFGTSGVWDLEPGELLTEKMILRGEDQNYSNNCGKCMHRPEAVKFCHIHDACQLKPGFRFRHAKPDEIRIHHYWARTEKFCLAKRGVREPKNELGESFDCVEDRTMAQYIPALKKALSSAP